MLGVVERTETSRRRQRPGGFTLLEVLLVLAILVTLAGLSWPSVSNMLDTLAMDEAVEPVRQSLAKTRTRALDAGVTWQFRFEPQGRRYLVAPYELDRLDEDEEIEQEQLALLPRISGQLPEGFSFVAASENLEGIENVAPQAVAGLNDQKQLGEASWSPPVLFYSDGAAIEGSFDIVDPNRQFRRLTVRALTGGGALSDADSLVR